ncbi:Shedu anti-phage system protein SduA domain-containing protein [Candidatus Proelusimicrobium volucris]|uniref:Shedu anti-phage system protein SduA domain-containing protein n=1 Tax=Candidatus Proelusimicrobium volucris TaxID=3416225 RepID=UPI003D0B336D
MAKNDLHLVFEHNIIEHLGVKLYQNRPTNVFAELVSNSWDADAENIWVTTSPALITFSDDGRGMSYEDIRDTYLHIGKTTRDLTDLTKRTNGKKRPIMAKKGIGKLAVFGIAKKLTLLTIKDKLVNMVSIDLASIESKMKEGKVDYQPELIIYKQPLSKDLNSVLPKDYAYVDAVNKFYTRLYSSEHKTGSLLIMSNLSTKKDLSEKQISDSLIKRFCGIFDKNETDHLTLFFNDVDIYSPLIFDFRIPENGYTEHTFDDGNKIKYYIGFKMKPEWSTEQAGIGIYTNQKIAQDRFFAFNVKGREIFTRYMFGVIQADWLDLIKPDLISTDRTSLDWENPALTSLYNWGTEMVKSAVNKFQEYREKIDRDNFVAELTKARSAGKLIPQLSAQEEGDVASIIAKVTASIPEEKKEEIQELALSSWINEPAWRNLLDTWKELLNSDTLFADKFVQLMKSLQEKAVFCSMTVAMVVAQKIYALALLQQMCNKYKEQDLQRLLESYPWILHPTYDKYQANKAIKTFALTAYKQRYNVAASTDNDSLKPDFIFYSESENDILVVELKHPNEDLIQENYTQLSVYIDLLTEKYPTREIKGILIGHNVAGIKNKSPQAIIVKDWDEVIKDSFTLHSSVLKTIIEKTPVSGKDSRIDRLILLFKEKNIKEFLQGIKKLGDQHVLNVLSKFDDYLKDDSNDSIEK